MKRYSLPLLLSPTMTSSRMPASNRAERTKTMLVTPIGCSHEKTGSA
jgi:hypothetical protein